MVCKDHKMGAVLEESAVLIAQTAPAESVREMRLYAPRIASLVAPGQFVHVALPAGTHLLRRPISVFDADPASGEIDLIYQIVGEGTAILSELSEGVILSLIGPVGRGWDLEGGEGSNYLLVGAGIGAAPLHMAARALASQGAEVSVCLGARTGDLLVCREAYEALGLAEVRVVTDDGSEGEKAFVTEPAGELLSQKRFDKVLVCGPEIVMRKIAALAAEAGVACQVSLERRMACGIGACLGCTLDTVSGRKRACVDGPVFDAEEVVWQ